jgi:hypothetical protein
VRGVAAASVDPVDSSEHHESRRRRLNEDLDSDNHHISGSAWANRHQSPVVVAGSVRTRLGDFFDSLPQPSGSTRSVLSQGARQISTPRVWDRPTSQSVQSIPSGSQLRPFGQPAVSVAFTSVRASAVPVSTPLPRALNTAGHGISAPRFSSVSVPHVRPALPVSMASVPLISTPVRPASVPVSSLARTISVPDVRPAIPVHLPSALGGTQMHPAAPPHVPPMASAPAQPPIASVAPTSLWSFTVSRKQDDIPSSWLNRSAHYLKDHAVSGVFGLEKGGQKKQLHLQGVVELQESTAPTNVKKVKKHFCDFLPTMPGDPRHITIKPFEPGQELPAMVGYCIKDAGQPHFQFVHKNIPEDVFQRAARSYSNVKLNYNEGKQELYKVNILLEVYRFWYRFFRPKAIDAALILYYMLLSKQYVISQKWFATAGGIGQNQKMVESWMTSVCHLDALTVYDCYIMWFGRYHRDSEEWNLLTPREECDQKYADIPDFDTLCADCAKERAERAPADVGPIHIPGELALDATGALQEVFPINDDDE